MKIGDKEFDKVRLEAAPNMTDKVAAAMADKYSLDILIRHESHPMTACLVDVSVAGAVNKRSAREAPPPKSKNRNRTRGSH